MALRYICLSDLHLGAPDSLLTHIDDHDTVDPQVPSRVLVAFAKALRATVSALSDGEPPMLVLLGDVLDLGLSPSSDVAPAFMRFLEALFPPDEPRLFSTDLWIVPGNHDNLLWDQARAFAFIDEIGPGGTVAPGSSRLGGTPLLQPDPASRIGSPLLNRLVRLHPGLETANAFVAYPNLGLASRDGSRMLVLHHGHYLDAMYRLVSRFETWLQGNNMPPQTMDDLAANGPWISFLWSQLGNAGDAGQGAWTLYEIMLDAGASHQMAGLVADRLVNALKQRFAVLPRAPLFHGISIEELVRAAVDFTLGHAAESQRLAEQSVLSTDELADLRWYVSTPLWHQIAATVGPDHLPSHLGFIFGHTHKPFQDQVTVPGQSLPVAVYNTGGWVLDQPTLMPSQGGAAMLIDDDLNVASLRLFNDEPDGGTRPVHAGGLGGFIDAENILLHQVQAALQHPDTADLWQAFSDSVKDGINKRVTLRMQEFFKVDAAAEVLA
ncbi:hypothetical protein CHU93_02855 [Sandarakinorhabdus cyanobacteriorum]|uniref:Calcineurin-like phosphoesterase domain-containing protein n=1 Tax=Sandarakinorhabdus cyanobacteriorum TaxID=1981098 RepID=A0A255YXB6_9SPHN|nr:metallophosphoesterase [Sandarakinorhabdus cyanobacteriorum]OYQ33876.1 hypothetical protein CHU93_02855 [Sandarakinorhabdus cyanobacteriorum]